MGRASSSHGGFSRSSAQDWVRDDTAGIGEDSTGGGVPGNKAEPATEGDVPPGLGLGLKQGKDRGKAGGRGQEQPRRCEEAGGSQEPVLQAWPERAAQSEWGATCQALGSLRASLWEPRSQPSAVG